MRNKLLLLVCLTAIGCNEGPQVPEKCQDNADKPRCTEDGTAIEICVNKRWERKSCAEACVYTESGAVCDKSSETAECQPGDKYCTANGLLAECGSDSKWAYSVCAGGCKDAKCAVPETECTPGEKQCTEDGRLAECGSDSKWAYSECANGCKDGQCTTPEPKPEPQKEAIADRRCSSDKKAIELLNAAGKVVETLPCTQTGFETECRSYSNGHVGCAMPEACTGAFEKGKCHGDTWLGCNTDLIVPQPYAQDCTKLDSVCADGELFGGCYKTCTNTKASFRCTKDGLVSRCVQAGEQKIQAEATAVCKSETVSVSCSNGKTVETTCGSGAKCLESLGVCSDLCSASEVNSLKCSESGEMHVCQAVREGYAYVSAGRRHCLGDILNTCVDNNGTYSVKQTDCANYVDDKGTTIKARCVSDYGYYTDYDVCMPVVEGAPCENITDSGVCVGTKLRYCHTDYNILMEGDCAQSQDGFTRCSVVSEFADCRKPCSKSGEASCALGSDGETYVLSLCMEQDNGGNLTVVNGTTVCSGNTLYACSQTGTVEIENCEASGGVCDKNRCIYPACAANTVQCLADNAVIACDTKSDGMIKGEALQSMFCDENGTCISCKDGNVVKTVKQ